MRRRIFCTLEFLLLFLVAFSVLTFSDALTGHTAEKECSYIRHDHYKQGYRIRHKHEICGKVIDHYKKEDAFTVDVLYLPEFYMTEDDEKE